VKKICKNGYKISNADEKALNRYLNVDFNQWIQNALNGMINKATKSIINDYLELYKSKQTESIASDLSILIPAIIEMPEFKSYNYSTVEEVNIKRKQPSNKEVIENGFEIEDWQEQALNAFYANYEDQLYYFMKNKVNRRKEAFNKEFTNVLMKEKSNIPVHQDDLIDLITARSGYKTRKQEDAEMLAKITETQQ